MMIDIARFLVENRAIVIPRKDGSFLFWCDRDVPKEIKTHLAKSKHILKRYAIQQRRHIDKPCIVHLVPWALYAAGSERMLYYWAKYTSDEYDVWIVHVGEKSKVLDFSPARCVSATDNELVHLLDYLLPDVIVHHCPTIDYGRFYTRAPSIWVIHRSDILASTVPTWVAPHTVFVNSPIDTSEWLRLPIVIVPLGIDLDRYVFVPRKPRLSDLVCGIVGRIHPEKIPLSFVKAFVESKCDKWRLRIIGANVYAEYIRQIKNLGKDRVEIITDVPPDAMPNQYAKLDALIIPTSNKIGETGNYAAVEAMACGVPVIARNNSGIRYQCGSAALYGNTNEDLIALLRTLEDPDTRHNYSVLGMAQAETYHDIKKQSAIWKFFIKESIKTNKCQFDIFPGYNHRIDAPPCLNTDSHDPFQRNIYRYASDLAKRHGLTSVLDIGTGSGKKLVEFFPDSRTIGTEIPEVIDKIRQYFPDREWHASDLTAPCPFQDIELIIVADVIEHLPDPDALMRYILSCKSWKYAVLSTPARDILPFRTAQTGPPYLVFHVREWSFNEFRKYISRWLYVEDHEWTALPNYGQLIVARPPIDVTVFMICHDTPVPIVKEAVDSIMAQNTTARWELLIIDDASTDEELVKFMQDLSKQQNVRYYRMEPFSRGFRGIVRNYGLQRIRSEFMLIVDSDDIISPDLIEHQYQYMKEHPEVDVRGVQLIAFNSIDECLFQTKHPSRVSLQDVESGKWMMNHGGSIWRVDKVLGLGGYSHEFTAGEDLDLTRRALRSGFVIENSDKVLYRWRRKT